MKNISVIIPCFNEEAYIKECFKFLMNQTIGFENLQIIFVDDASIDNTGEILDLIQAHYSDNVEVVHLLSNCKQGGARNIGLSLATGKYIAFLDADDWVDVTMYQKLYDIAEQYNTEIIQYPMIKYYNGITRVEDPAEIKGPIILEDDEMQKLFLTGQAMTCGSQSKLYKRSFVEKVGARFIEGCAYEEPSFVYPLLLSVKRAYCTTEPLYYYRMHEDSTMHRYVRQPGRLMDHAVVQLSVLKDVKNRKDLWQRFHDEIIYYFVLTYYIETLYFAGSCGLELTVANFEELQRTVLEETPEYMENTYLQSPSFDFREALLLLDKKVSQEELNRFCESLPGGMT